MKISLSRSILTVLLLLPSLAFAQTTHIVNQISFSFSPNDLTINVGDTVRWVRSNGSHTVTSGTGASDPNVGNLFDAPLNSSNTTFEFTFNSAGDVNFFCRPHEGANMKGVIRVSDVSAVDDIPLVAAVRLEAPHPNPFNPRAQVRFTLAEAGPVDLVVFDARGRLVKTLLAGVHREATEDRVFWDGTNNAGSAVPSGTYLFRVRTGRHEEVVKGMLVR
jgi:plastocyanin